MKYCFQYFISWVVIKGFLWILHTQNYVSTSFSRSFAIWSEKRFSQKTYIWCDILEPSLNFLHFFQFLSILVFLWVNFCMLCPVLKNGNSLQWWYFKIVVVASTNWDDRIQFSPITTWGSQFVWTILITVSFFYLLLLQHHYKVWYVFD